MVPLELPALNQFAAIATVIVGWVTIVRWTRDSNQGEMWNLQRQFWINHSVDLRYGVGTGPKRVHSDKKLIIRGLETYDYGWWFSPHERRGEVSRARDIRLRLEMVLKRIGYGFYRNFRPGASLWMECSLLIEGDNCQISIKEDLIESEEGVIGGRGRSITETVPEIQSFTEIPHYEENLYKVGFDEYRWGEVADAVVKLTQSDHIKDPDLRLPQ